MNQLFETDFSPFALQAERASRIKTAVKLVSGFLWNQLGLMHAYLRLGKTLGDCPCLVLAYHRVLPRSQVYEAPTELSLVVSAETFEKQVLFLKRYFKILTIDQFVATLSTGSSFPEPSCVLTFDDGWIDTYLYAYPILKRFSIPATVFVATRHVESGAAFWFDTLYRMIISSDLSANKALDVISPFFPGISTPKTGNPGDVVEYARKVVAFMKAVPLDQIDEIIRAAKTAAVQESQERTVCSWDELKEMISSGLVTIGSHTVSHAILTREEPNRCWKELAESKKVLEERLGVPVEHFCYPNGNYNGDVEDLVRKAGYKSACPGLYGVNRGNGSPFAIHRTAFSELSSCVSVKGFSHSLFSYQLLSCLLR